MQYLISWEKMLRYHQIKSYVKVKKKQVEEEYLKSNSYLKKLSNEDEE